MTIRAGLLATLFLLAAGPSWAQDAGGAVRLTLMPRLSIALPQGWLACDPAIDRQLGHDSQPDDMKQACATDENQLVAAHFSPTIQVQTNYDAKEPFPLDALKSFKSDDLQHLLCEVMKEKVQASEVLSCEASLSTFSGEPAVLTHAVFVRNDIRSEINAIVLPYDGGSFRMFCFSMADENADAKPLVEAIFASLVLAPN